MAQNAVYRVCGGKLYKGESEVGDVAGSGRVSMAHGRTSQAVGVNGQLVEYRYDGTVKTVSNWPTDSGFTQYELGSVRDITRLRGRYAWSKDGTVLLLSLTLRLNPSDPAIQATTLIVESRSPIHTHCIEHGRISRLFRFIGRLSIFPRLGQTHRCFRFASACPMLWCAAYLRNLPNAVC